jgi:hypothetical protein
MKNVRTPGFLIDLRRLPDEHHPLFVQAKRAGRDPGRVGDRPASYRPRLFPGDACASSRPCG